MASPSSPIAMALIVPKPEPIDDFGGNGIAAIPSSGGGGSASPFLGRKPKLELPVDNGGGGGGGGDQKLLSFSPKPEPVENHDDAGFLSDDSGRGSGGDRGISREIVRVSYHDPRLYRGEIRRVRAVYESLRLRLAADDAASPPPPGRRHRADLRAASLMRRRGLWLHRDKRIVGGIPGVVVGDAFFYRIELCLLGVHSEAQAGIDYVRPSPATGGDPVATSVVLSGGYLDDVDAGDVIIYTGSGGRAGRNDTAHSAHQVLDRRNLGLERSMAHGIEIRVVRGFPCDRSPSGRIYFYDGLYRVVGAWSEGGKSGFCVCKFKLVRIDGQEEMGSSVYRTAMTSIDALPELPPGFLAVDISGGKERVPVTVFNDVDSDREPLLGFEYSPEPIFPLVALKKKGVAGARMHCKCSTNCSTGECGCGGGGGFAYDGNGILLEGKPMVYECGSSCGCPESCRNRVTQKGLRHRLQVFRTKDGGGGRWGVRSLDVIRAGEFVCEIAGVAVATAEAIAGDNGGGFVYPCLFPARWAEWGVADGGGGGGVSPQLGFSMEVRRKRNVGCFLSHSGTPNLFVQLVMFDHQNEAFPRLMVFAMENIPPLRELSIDYGVEE